MRNFIVSCRIFLVAMAAGFVSVPANAQITRLPSVDSFFDFETIYSPQLSPDGKRLAVLRDEGEDRFLLIKDVEDSSNDTGVNLKGLEPLSVQWANNERVLVRLLIEQDVKLPGGYRVRDEDGNVSRTVKGYQIIRTMAVDTTGQNSVLLFASSKKKVQRSRDISSVTSILPSDPDHILMPVWIDPRLRLFKVNIHSGDAVEVHEDNAKTYAWKVDQNGYPVVRFDMSSGGRWVKVFVRASGEKKWSRLMKVRREDIKSFTPLGPTSDPTIYYVSARPEGADKAGIYKYDLVNKKYLEAVSTHDRVDLSSALQDQEGNYAGVVYNDRRLTYDFKDPVMAAHYKAINTFFDNAENVRARQVSADGKRWLLGVDGPQNPGGIYVYDSVRKHIEPIANYSEDLEATVLGATRIIDYTSRDGTALYGLLTNPSQGSGTAGTPPLIVLPHGGPEARDYYGFDPMVQFLASRGYRIWQPHFRGSSGYGKAFAEAGYGEWGGLMQDDVTDGVEHLIKTGQARRGKICIAGISYGGYAALMGAVKTPDLYACAMSINGVTDLVDMAQFDLKKFGKSSDEADYVRKAMGDPKTDAVRMSAHSPARQAAKIKIPVSIVQGMDDNTVPLQQARLMNTALQGAGQKPDYLELPGVGHSLYGADPNSTSANPDNAYGYKRTLREMETFFGKHLKEAP